MKFINKLVIIFMTFTSVAQDVSYQALIAQCRLIQTNQERLNCYDRIESSGLQYSSSDSNSNNDSQVQYIEEKMPVLLADLDEPRLFSSIGQLDFLENEFNAILLGVGTRFKMKTFDFSHSKQSYDFNFITLIQSQFDVDELDTRNNRGGALINTDFMLGGEMTKQSSFGHLRLRYTHKSTHLGDEFLIDNPEFLKQRLNLSYETIDFLAFKQMNNWGGYLGASAIVRSEPGNLDKFKLQTGLQFKGTKGQWFAPVFGIDLKSWQASNWHLNASLKAGFEYSGFLNQPIQLMLEYYDGKSPYGQFYTEDLSFLGFSVSHFW